MTRHLPLRSSALKRLLTPQGRNASLTPLSPSQTARMSTETPSEPAAKRQKKEEYVLYYVRL